MTRTVRIPTLLGAALALGLAATAPTASADPPGRHAERGQRGPDPARVRQRIERMAERVIAHLGLDEARAAKVREIGRRSAERASRLLRETPRGPRRHLAMMRLRMDTADAVYALLTCEEKDRFRALERQLREEHVRRRMERRMGRHGVERGRGHGRPHRGRGGR